MTPGVSEYRHKAYKEPILYSCIFLWRETGSQAIDLIQNGETLSHNESLDETLVSTVELLMVRTLGQLLSEFTGVHLLQVM